MFLDIGYRYKKILAGDGWQGAILGGDASVNQIRIGAGVRFNWIEPNTELDHDNAFELEPQVAWMINPPELALKLRYAWLKQQIPDEDERGDFALPYVEGTTHLITLQLTFAF